MFDLDQWQEIFDTIRRHKLRTALTAFGVGWGIFMLIILMGAGNGLQNGVEYDFRDDAINSIWIYSGTTSVPYKGLPPGREINFKLDDFNQVKGIEGIEHSTPRNYLRGEYFITHKNKSGAFDIRATHPGHKYVENTEIIKGRFLNDVDIAEKRKVAAIGINIVDALYEKDEEPLGTFIMVKGAPYKVVGVFKDSGHVREMDKIYIPHSTCNLVYNQKNDVHQMMFTTGDATLEESEVIAEEMRAILAKQHKFSPKDRQAIYVNNNNAAYQEILSLFMGIKSIVWFVSIGTLIAGVVGVGNIMLIIVKERTREIGIRKALGATPKSIIGLIVQEAILITSIAGYMGLVAGVGMLELMNMAMGEGSSDTMFRNPEISLTVAIVATVVLIISGTIAGLIPAMQAARVNPIEALREE